MHVRTGGFEEHYGILQSWIAKLEEDNRLIVHAAANAQRAVDSIIDTSFEAEEERTEKADEEAACCPNAGAAPLSSGAQVIQQMEAV